MHSDVPSGSNITVLPSPALTGVILEAHPLDVVLWAHVNQEVRQGRTLRCVEGQRWVQLDNSGRASHYAVPNLPGVLSSVLFSQRPCIDVK